MDWAVEEWHQVVDLNTVGLWLLSRPAAKPMLEQGKVDREHLLGGRNASTKTPTTRIVQAVQQVYLVSSCL